MKVVEDGPEYIVNKFNFFREVIFRTFPIVGVAVPLKLRTVNRPPNEKGNLPKTVPKSICICIWLTCYGVCS